MKVFVALFSALALAAASQDSHFVQREFELFEQKFGKNYASAAERAKRFNIFKSNLAQVQEHNLSGKTWQEGITKFFDLTQDEFVSTLNGYVNTKKAPVPIVPSSDSSRTAQLPASIDWRELGVVTAVKDQGACGSCWAFAGAQSIESYAALNDGSLVELSAQQMTTCTPNELECGGTGGCAGSIPQLGFTYSQLFGLTGEAEYPYVSGTTGATGECIYDPEEMPAQAYVRGFEVLPRNDYDSVMDHLANIGPLSVAVDASAWGFYFGGVFDGCPYDQNIAINHAVQLVGYGTDETEGDYWLVRNSWGESAWGEDGYIRLRRDSSQLTTQCGIDSTPLSGTACVNDGQDEQYVCGTCAILFDVSYPIGATLV